ncbi:hypothetical protein [Novipirellula aureliae]|uniref:hypothetical protein n=1 Tax=Novipirellula aureliae TaxID=2527966 RepID=UPI0018CF246C|nr:hypothetical protein [Novipirellula aureliae]
MLYHLKSDPYEQNDLAKEMPELFQSLSKRLEAIEAIEASCQESRDGADYVY